MALPLPSTRPVLSAGVVSPKFVEHAYDFIQRFTREQLRPPVVLLIGYDPVLLQLPVARLVVCDVNAPDGPNMVRQHSVRLGAGLEVDMVLLNVFNSATMNRWAPVYIMRDLLRRRILRTFPSGTYVYPSKGTMSLRLYEHPTCQDALPKTAITWHHSTPLTNTDLLIPYGPRVDVLYEQYDAPAQTWPSVISFDTTKKHMYPLIAVLEWSVQLSHQQTWDHLAVRGRDILMARRLLVPGMSYFVWPTDLTQLRLNNMPKASGGVHLTVATASKCDPEVSLSLHKMDSAIERWFGAIVSMQISF